MSDEKKTRKAIDRVALRIQTESKKSGNKTMSFEDARCKAQKIAVSYERKQKQ